MYSSNRKSHMAPNTNIIEFAKYYAKLLEEIGDGVISFIPNGLEQIYDKAFKRFPVLGKIFQHQWVEQVVKLGLGITIGQGVGRDVARFVFWPIGFCLGALLGIGLKDREPPQRQHGIGQFLYKLSGPTLAGALLGASSAALLHHFVFKQAFSFVWVMSLGTGSGAALGMVIYGIYMLVLTVVKSQQVKEFYEQVSMAKKLGGELKESARQIAKGRILIYAQDIIQQMNGPTAQSDLTAFFESDLDAIVQLTSKKIDRHVCYLTEKASHGDEQALYRLQVLVNQKADLNKLLDRVFNPRAIAKIKDEIDTRYDRWHYRFLKV